MAWWVVMGMNMMGGRELSVTSVRVVGDWFEGEMWVVKREWWMMMGVWGRMSGEVEEVGMGYGVGGRVGGLQGVGVGW